MENKRTFVPKSVDINSIKETREGPNGSKVHILTRTSFELEFECLFENQELLVWVWVRPDGIDFDDNFKPEEEPSFSFGDIFKFVQIEWKKQFPEIPPSKTKEQIYYAPETFEPPTRALEQFTAGIYQVFILPLSKSQDTIVDDPEFDFIILNENIWALLHVGFDGFSRSKQISSLDVSKFENWELVKSEIMDKFLQRISTYISNRNKKELPFCQPLWEKNQHLHPDPIVREMSLDQFQKYLSTPVLKKNINDSW